MLLLFRQLPLLLICLTATPLLAQADNEVLFTVGNEEVTVGEFKYIYTKSNGDEADFSKQSIQEYLDLYERFKLKVARARSMGLDTITALQQELEVYRQQLADNYIVDRQITDKLVDDLYERRKQDIEFSHIYLQFGHNRTPADTLRLYQRALQIKSELTPDNFKSTAGQVSDDKFSKDRGGYVGYVHPPFPRGLDRLEAALYNAPAGKIIGPIQSNSGYHLALKHATRPAMGEMEVAHILVRKPSGSPMGQEPPQKILKAQAELEAGKDFDEVARKYSDDLDTKANGGYLGFFGINVYDPEFEKAAFALSTDDQVSDIVETKSGFHLIRRISRRRNLPLNDIRPELERQVKDDERFARAKRQLLSELREEAQLRIRKNNFSKYTDSLDPVNFASAHWKPTQFAENDILFTLADGTEHTIADFQQYMLRNGRQRLSMARVSGAKPTVVAKRMFNKWIDEEVMKYAEQHLEENYPDFAALMREYREGILLFEATNLEVWEKASQDTAGLRAFYENNRENYHWEPRASVSRYTINTRGGLDVNEVITYATKNGPDAVAQHFGELVDVHTDAYEYDRLESMEQLEPRAGSVSTVKNDLRAGNAVFYQVNELLPAGPKELEDARGYVIADYQDELERLWVNELRAIYPVKINKRVLRKLIK